MKSSRHYCIFAVAFSTSIVMACPRWAAAQSIDLYQSFPDSQGDNGFFAYGYAAATNTYWSLSDVGAYKFNRPEEGIWNNPQVFKDGYSGTWIGEGWVGLTPSGTRGNTGYPEDATLAWVAPAGITSYDLRGTFYDYPGSLNGVDAYIKLNNTVLWSSYLSSGAAATFDVSSPSIAAGDVVYFGVGAHNDMYFSEYNDWGFVNGQINIVNGQINTTPVPAPSAVWLFLSGLATLFVRFRKHIA